MISTEEFIGRCKVATLSLSVSTHSSINVNSNDHSVFHPPSASISCLDFFFLCFSSYFHLSAMAGMRRGRCWRGLVSVAVGSCGRTWHALRVSRQGHTRKVSIAGSYDIPDYMRAGRFLQCLIPKPWGVRQLNNPTCYF